MGVLQKSIKCFEFKRCISGTFLCPRLFSTEQSVDKKREYDVVFVGAGIVGTAAARELSLRYPSLKYAILDKENSIAAHQSSNNSGVIHAGIYYTPGSMKAKLCVEGLKLTYKYCDEYGIPYKKCGKLIVATTPEEVSRLSNLYERGIQNEVPDLEVIDQERIKEIEPYCKGLKALYSPHTGIVDYGEMAKSFAANFKERGGKIHLGAEVIDFKENTTNPEYPIRIVTSKSRDPVDAKYVIVCGGLFADRLAKISGCSEVPKIVPFRGEYLLVKPEKRHLVRGNIYPVPDPKFPFLGVHFTPRMNGDIWLGPNAALAFKREGYSIFDISPRDLTDAIAFKGLRKLVFSNLTYAFGELYRGVNTSAQVKILQKFIPELSPSDVTRGPAGVRAQALDEQGNLVDDFIFDRGVGNMGEHIIHVRNAPSPAATSSLAIAKVIADKAGEQFQL